MAAPRPRLRNHPRLASIALALAATAAASCARDRDPSDATADSARHDAPSVRGERPSTTDPPPPAGDGWTDAFPHIRVSTALRTVEVDGAVSDLAHPSDPDKDFYLEQFVCKRGTKDHESPIVTDAAPSHIHAALLLLGAEPGSPATWTYPDGVPTVSPPTGPEVDVLFIVDGAEVDPRNWAVDRTTGARFPAGRWVFAGSTERTNAGRTFYEADAAGTIVGLASFGSEVIAWADPISHEEEAGDLRWVARREVLPDPGTPITIRLTLP